MLKKFLFLSLVLISYPIKSHKLDANSRSFTLEELISIDQQTHEWVENNLFNASPEDIQLLANFTYFSALGAQLNYQVSRFNDLLLLQINVFRNEITHNVYNQNSFIGLNKTLNALNHLTPYSLHIMQAWQNIAHHIDEYLQENPHLLPIINTLQELGISFESLSAENEQEAVQKLIENITLSYENCLHDLPITINQIKSYNDFPSTESLTVIDQVSALTKLNAQHGWDFITAGIYSGSVQRNLVASGHYFYKALYQALYEWMEQNAMHEYMKFIIGPEGILTQQQQNEELPNPTDDGMFISSVLN